MLQASALSYRFPTSDSPAAGPLDVRFAPGTFTLVTGPTGSGKSTLLRLLAGLLQRHGQGAVGGQVKLDGLDPATLHPAARAQKIAFVSQDPSDQIIAGTVAEEVAFAPQSARWSRENIDDAVGRWLDKVGLDLPLDRNPLHLSGGQQQRLVIAGGLAAGAQVILLDEPLSQLDPSGAAQVIAVLRDLADQGMTVVMVEHRIAAVWSFVDRVVVLESGRVAHDEAPADMDLAVLRNLGLSIPGLADLEDRLMRRGLALGTTRFEPPEMEPSKTGDLVVQAESLAFAYDTAPVLAIEHFEVHAGDRVAVLGANGSGKSTLLHALAGSLDAGRCVRRGTTILVPQQADLTLFNPSVAEELAYGPTEARMDDESVEARIRTAEAVLNLHGLMERVPQALSQGQRMRVAIGAALTTGPTLLLLDEPTAGLHAQQVDQMMEGLSAALANGALVFATHDVALAARSATRIVVLDGGRIIHDGPPETVLRGLDSQGVLAVPPLIRWCLEQGLPPSDAPTLDGWAR